jgi:eukaryotic-like serine/threonine-protein kinase
MPLSVGDKLGPYEILASIGEGGMGEVWKARDSRLDRIVALKVSKREFSERFEREARSIAALNHPHICQLYDVGPNYLVMEFVEGSPLKGPLPLEQALRFAAQICDALDAAHRKGITHRDLKPANILVTKQGIKLLDFGLAHVAPGENDLTLTVKGTVMGTPAYMAPEQWEGKAADARSDIYAFGCVLYEMLTGKRAAQERLPVEPAPLESILRTCLEKDPEDRWQSARDIRRALTLPAPSAAKPTRRWQWIAAAMLVCGALAGWAFAHFHPSPADERLLRFQIEPPEGSRFMMGINLGGIALSPDGKTAAFIATADGKGALWVQRLDSGTARFLPGTEGAADPFWSPDSRSIGFFGASGTKLLRVDAAGGTPQVICDASVDRGGTWGDGQIIFGTVGSGLLRVPASGGTPSAVTNLDASRGESSHRWPQMLPDGRVLYWIQSEKPENAGVYVTSLAQPSGRAHILTTDTNALYAPGADGSDYLLWLRSGTLLAQAFDTTTLKLSGEPRPVADPVASIGITSQMDVAASAAGLLLYSASNPLSQFTWFDRAGNPLGVVGEPGEYDAFRLSRDQRRVVASRYRPGGTDLWVLETERGVANRFTSRPGISSVPVWSPDGRTIVFSSGFPRNLFRKKSTGAGDEERIRQSRNTQLAEDWSRDGRFVSYYEIAADTHFDLWVLPVTPDGKPEADPRPYIRTPFNEWHGIFSPETNPGSGPRWVAYESDESGRYEIYIDSFPEPRGRVRISKDGGLYPEWSPDGRELYYVSRDSKLMAVSLKMGTNALEPSAPRELFSLRAVDTGQRPYEVAPDGKRFLVRAVPQRQSAQPLTVIVNWPAALKQAAPAP